KKIVEPYLKILDTHWDSQLKKNLHAAGYWLSPAFRFNAAEFEKHNEKRIYSNAEDDFGRQSALRERSTVMP
ncbi:hypothetical protein S83_043435, partial [Arachis hypogaea]